MLKKLIVIVIFLLLIITIIPMLISSDEILNNTNYFDNVEMLKDINPGSNHSLPYGFTSFNGEIFFAAYDGTTGLELWKTDGTEQGTVLVKDINTGMGNSIPWEFTVVCDTLFLRADNGINGTELWKSDGTESGTVMVKDIRTGMGNSWPWEFTIVDDTLLFSAEDNVYGRELWKSDGTESGTVMVKDINSVSGSSDPNDLVSFGENLFFRANDGISGFELWKSDGTESGTVMVKDINSGSGSSNHPWGGYPIHIIAIDNVIFFSADDGVNGTELWRSDGTESGTIMIKDINSGPGSSTPYDFKDVNGTLFFRADNGINGTELWKSDGTELGTVMVKDINSGLGSSLDEENSRGLSTVFDDMLYFRADNGINGTELWKSDGTEFGTSMVKDLNPYGHSYLQYFTVINNTIYFSATNGTTGWELYKTNGTDTGTSLVKDIYPGTESSFPTNMTSFGNIILFEANDGMNGWELWKVEISTIPSFEIYVDDDADPSWYDANHVKTIQEGIDNASTGGTIFVFNGTYYENVGINKSINLIGENRRTSMIVGVKGYSTIRINSNNINISDLTVVTNYGHIGIRAAQLNTIKNTSICLCNFYDDGEAGIELSNCIDSTIRDCIFYNNLSSGIQLNGAPNTKIISCSINTTIFGIGIHESDNVSVNKNLITNNSLEGIGIHNSNNCSIYHNNFINNFINVRDNGNNMWDNGYPTGGNYWDNYTWIDIFSGPYQNLTGSDGIGDKPFNISGGLNRDNYPFIAVSGWINHPPYTPSNPVPSDATTSVSITQIISWSGGDPDLGNTVTYDVYFGTTNPPPLSIKNQSGNVYDPGTLSYQTKYYWKIIARDNENESTEGPTWSFTTISKPSGGGGGGSGGGFIPIGPTNQPPVARINVSDNSVFIGEVITFDGNGSYDQDGSNIANWTWDFEDSFKGYGSVFKHSYSVDGIYSVTLTVKDEQGATDSESVDITVIKPNIPPLKPTIYGPTTGNKGNSYSYAIFSTEADNDTIQYIIDWGDNSSTTTQFLPSSTAIIQNHSWISAGIYAIKVKAYDNETISETSSYIVLIDVILIDEFSYLIDKDSDGNYDNYYNGTTDSEGNVQKHEDESYLIDINGDCEWDFNYNYGKGFMTHNIGNDKSTPGFELIFVILSLVIVYVARKKLYR